MKIKYIWQVTRDGYAHSKAFDEVVESFHSALSELGHPAEIVYKEPQRDGLTLVFGAHLAQRLLPPEFIIYNTEVIDADSSWMKGGYPRLLRNHQIWDYSAKNVAILKSRGLYTQHCEIGYMPCMTKIEKRPQDIDILFIGSSNSRRDLLMKTMSKNFKTEYKYNIYGFERDELIARAKIVLNLHYYENAPFEIFRCSYLMANSKCVISEHGDGEDKYYGAINFTDYGNIPDECERLLKDNSVRENWESCAYNRFSSMSQVEILKSVLEKVFP